MIVKNESALLPRCLTSVQKAVDEIIIVDTGSTDDTVVIARSYGATVVVDRWREDFSRARNASIKNANGTWILWLDADDLVPVDSIPRIRKLALEKPDKLFGMIVKNQRPNDTGSQFLQVRMFPRDPSIYFERAIHEQVAPSALRLGYTIVNTDIVIEHHGYADEAVLKKKAARNAMLLVKELSSYPHDPFLHIECADSFNIIEEYDKAVRWYTAALALKDIEKNTPVLASQAYMGIGTIHNKRERYGDAIDAFMKAVGLCPERTDTLYCLAVSFDLSDRKEEAAHTLQTILGKPHVPLNVGIDYRLTEIKASIRLARILKELHKNRDLETLYRLALEKWPHRPEIHNMAGQIHYHLNNLMEALHCFEKSLQLMVQDNIDAYTGLCMVYIKARQRGVAEDTVRKMEQGFKHLSRYWALRKIVTPSDDVPPDSSCTCIPADIDKEVAFIKQTFSLSPSL